MKITSEYDLSHVIKNDIWMMEVLSAAEKLSLPDWWVGAGFLRSKVWDVLEGLESKPTIDVDLVYFDQGSIRPEADWGYDEQMKNKYPFANWEVRNQARMHYMDDFPPYTSTADGIANWVETATCVAVKLENEKLKFLFCYGTNDLFGLIARPIPRFQTPELISKFYKRIRDKHWRERWPSLVIESE